MKITVANYTDKRTNIDFAKLPEQYAQGDTFVKENIDLYDEDESIKKFIDTFISKLNTQEGEKKAAPEKKKPEVKHVAKKPAKKPAAKKPAKQSKPKKPTERTQGEISLIDENLEKHTAKKGLVKALVEKEGEAKAKARPGVRFAPRDRMNAEAAIRKLIADGTEDKEELSTAEVVQLGRKINAERSLYSQFIDLAADHKTRRWPTEKNLKIWAKNPGESDLLGVDSGKKKDATMGKEKGKSLNFWMM